MPVLPPRPGLYEPPVPAWTRVPVLRDVYLAARRLVQPRQGRTVLTPHYGPIVRTLPNLTDAPLVIRDLVMYPSGPNQTAIDLSWPASESCINTTVIIENVHCVPGGYGYWLEGIKLTNAWNACLIRCNVIGPSGMVDPVSMNGITLAGSSTGVSILSYRCSGLVTGIYIRGDAEGTKIIDADIVGVNNGIVAWPESGGGEPGFWISDSHINATQWGLHMRDRYEVMTKNLLIYGGDYYYTTYGHPFYGVVAERCNEVTFSDVIVSNAGYIGNKPIVLQTLTNCGDGIFGEVRRAVA